MSAARRREKWGRYVIVRSHRLHTIRKTKIIPFDQESVSDSIIDYDALIARRKAQGLPSLFGDSDTDAVIGSRTLLPELREEKLISRGRNVQKELNDGKRMNGGLSSEFERREGQAQEATNEGLASDTRSRRVTPSPVISDFTQAPILTSESDREPSAPSTSGGKGSPKELSRVDKSAIGKEEGNTRHYENGEGSGLENGDKVGGGGKLSTTQSDRFISSSFQTPFRSASTSTTYSNNSQAISNNRVGLSNADNDGADSMIDENKLTPQERHYLNKALIW